MRFVFSSVMKMSKKVHTPAPYIKVDDFLDVLDSIGSHSYGTFHYKQFADIANHTGGVGTTNKLRKLREEVKTNRRAIAKYLDKDASTEHKTIIYNIWDYLFKADMYSGGNINEEFGNEEITNSLYAFFMLFIKQPLYILANSKAEFIHISEENEVATDDNKVALEKLNTDFFMNFLMKETDENSFSLKTSHHISSGMDMDYFWGHFHNLVDDSEGSYLPCELTQDELSDLFVHVDKVSCDHINEAIHYMFRLGYVMPEIEKIVDGKYVYRLCYANSFHETRIPIEYKDYKENYANILNLSTFQKDELKNLFKFETWDDILMEIADPITFHQFSIGQNNFTEKQFERVFVPMLKTQLEIQALRICKKLTQTQLDLMISVKGQVKKRKNRTRTLNRSFAMVDVEAKITLDYNEGERFFGLIELKKNKGFVSSMYYMLGGQKQYEEICGLESEKKVYVVASLNERGRPRRTRYTCDRNFGYAITDDLYNGIIYKGDNMRILNERRR
eukprot:GAHX01001321.1.p1 GENE.GAHX01001321.1~~GAHX01001321.1.p1  ORF type:complete len:504 (-),score=65.13 GAHX01001321.1:34-1545(-)